MTGPPAASDSRAIRGDLARRASQLPVLVMVGSLLGPSLLPAPAARLPVTVANDASPSLTIAPVADARVSQRFPTTNYGGSHNLRVRGGSSDAYRTYLKFDVTGIAGAVSSARLRLYVTEASAAPVSVYGVSSVWTESGIVWDTAPPLTDAAVATATTPAGTWAEFDLGSSVTANGLYSFAIASGSTDAASYDSRETVNQPQLVITPLVTSAPVASFTGSPGAGLAPLAVRFRDTSAGWTFSWAWDFDSDGGVDSTIQNPTFIYRAPGAYSVTLSAANAAGSSTVTLRLITVRPGPLARRSDPVLVGAGDIASCISSADEATAALLDEIPGVVFTAGDNAYESATAAEFADCYETSWGRHKSRTRPTPGNHEYKTPGATAYFDYFGPAAGDPSGGYYSYNLGSWHIVALNSNCQAVGGCGVGSPQESWLRADLGAHRARCTLAYWHHPLFSSGEHGNFEAVKPLWDALWAAGAEVVVSGHDHSYERFAPQTPNGIGHPHGIREIVVGTGGRSLRDFTVVRPNSEVRDNTTAGVLKLTLHPTGYTWEFLPVLGGAFRDAGAGFCHRAPTAARRSLGSISLAPQALALRVRNWR